MPERMGSSHLGPSDARTVDETRTALAGVLVIGEVMDTFTASNGRVIGKSVDHLQLVSIYFGADGASGEFTMTAAEYAALREFFQAERDEELGRWRWPENPDYVVYPTPGYTDEVTVADERDGEHYTVMRDRADGNGWAKPAARAYFEAHLERNLWEDAKEGDVWLLTINGEEEALLFRHDRTFISRDGDEFAPEESYITAGRRIWPEVSDAD